MAAIPKEELLLVRRPDFGNKGRSIKVNTNCYPIMDIPRADIYHYDVNIEPDVPPRVNRLVMSQWENENRQGVLRNTLPVYDGRHGLFCLKDFGQPVTTFSVQLPDREEDSDRPADKRRGPRVFNVVVKHVSTIKIADLYSFLQGKELETPLKAIQALDIAFRHLPATLYTSVGRNFFSPENATRISGGAELWGGFHQSVRPAGNALVLNVDTAAAAFYQSGPVPDFVAEILGRRASDLRQALMDGDILRVERYLKNLRVSTTHRGASKRKYKIAAITRQAANRTFFHDESGRELDVAAYFEEKYNIRLKYPHLPCLTLNDPKKGIQMPMEVCIIASGQRILKKLNEKQTADMIKFTCQKPTFRAQRVSKGHDDLKLGENPYLQAFNLKVGDRMLEVDARVLDVPRVYYHPNSRENSINPTEGKWNLRDKKVAKSVQLTGWSVVDFASMNSGALDNFISELAGTCIDTGLPVMNLKPPVRAANPNSNIESILKAAYVDASGPDGNVKPQLIVCILPSTAIQLYGEIKRVSDTVIGIPTQCVQSKHASAAKKQYCANVCLKMNVKLGGMNSFLGSQQLPFVGERPTIVIGADVTHPGPGDHNKPSIAALVGSVDAQCSRYSGSVRVQSSHEEHILELEGMVVELLQSFYANSGSKPERLIFYRDGVSDGQFKNIVPLEIASIRNACNSMEAGYCPKLSYIVVQKRHHIRFFPISQADQDRSGNCRPGTLVDQGITHPTQFDFFLQSHAGLQGTSKPVHYHVLFDENVFQSNAIQELTYRLCYIYCRATCSVSVCPPAYYAHLLAYRARFHTSSGGSGSSWEGSESGFSRRSDDSAKQEAILNQYSPVKADLSRVMYFM